MVVQRDNEQPCTFRERLTASRGCANRLRAMNVERRREAYTAALDGPLGGRWFLACLRACAPPADLGDAAHLYGRPVTIRQELPL